MSSICPRKTLIMMPVVAIVGAALGAAVARDSAVPLSSAMFWSAVALCLSSWASAVLEGSTVGALGTDPDGSIAGFTAFAYDAIFGVLTGVFLGKVASADVLEAAGAASAFLFVQTLVIDRLILRNSVGNAFVTILQGRGRSRPDYSLAESLAVRGDIAGAQRLLEAAITADPHDPTTYRMLARILRVEGREYEGAVAVLQRALKDARLDGVTHEAVMREVAELHLHFLDAPGRAATLLAKYISEKQSTHDVKWARDMLKAAKERNAS